MKILRSSVALTFLAGAVLLTFGFACSGGDDDDEPTPFQEFDARASETPSPTATSEASATPTATPVPFNGRVARMKIPKLGVDYPIEELGLIPGVNQLDTPHNATGAIGWYHIYPKPGWQANALFSAHVNYNGSNGPFARLSQAQMDDQILIQMEEGPEYTYKVIFKKRYATEIRYAKDGLEENVIKMGDIIEAPSKPLGKEWITLITCSCEPGRIVNLNAQGFGECVDRDVVIAERIS